jgi:hypothetical protein
MTLFQLFALMEIDGQVPEEQMQEQQGTMDDLRSLARMAQRG